MSRQEFQGTLGEEIKRAMDEHELVAYYQPQYDAITNRLDGAEALARWIKKDGTVVMPGQFIPPLEQSGEICELDWYMLREMCQFLKKLLEKKAFIAPISVNFSRLHIEEADFHQVLCDTVDGYGVPRNLVVIEVTESAFVEQPYRITDWITKIRENGFSVAIDDFGSGLSSLSFVKDTSSDILKVDRTLLSRNCEDEKERVVLESIFYFAHRLNMKIIVEGVETREQLGFLKTAGCELIQGFLFAKPMPEESFTQLCLQESEPEEEEDILLTQPTSSAMKLLMDAVFIRYPLVIFVNLSRNSYYMMAYENFSTKACASTGVFEELIEGGATTMHPDDQETFKSTFCIENQMKEYQSGKKYIRLLTRQLGDDGVYREVETSNYFVKNPSSKDVLVISLCHNIEDSN